MTPLDPSDDAAEAPEQELPEPQEHFPARRLLAHDQDDAWLLDEVEGWRPMD